MGNYQYKQWEHHIDQLAYQLYDLTEDEIKIVEGMNYEKQRRFVWYK